VTVEQNAPRVRLVTAPSTRLLLNVGLVTTSRPADPDAGRRFRDGLTMGLTATPWVRALVRHAESDGGYDDALGAVLRVLDGGAHLVVADVPGLAAELLAQTCHERGVPLLLAGSGAEVAATTRPGVVHCTQQQWQAAYTLGDWAARHLDGPLFQVVAARDAVFDVVRSLRQGYVDAGGVAAGQATTHDRVDETGVADAAVAALLSGARVVAVHANAAHAAEIARGLRAAGVRADLLVDAPAAEDGALGVLARSDSQIWSASSWCRADSPDFARAHRVATGRAADPAAAIGHDVAVLLGEAARRLGLQQLPWRALDEVLADVDLEGARGRMNVDPATRSVCTPLLVRRVRMGRNVVVARRPAVTGVPLSLRDVAVTEPVW
jgi:hypothetical protein